MQGTVKAHLLENRGGSCFYCSDQEKTINKKSSNVQVIDCQEFYPLFISLGKRRTNIKKKGGNANLVYILLTSQKIRKRHSINK